MSDIAMKLAIGDEVRVHFHPPVPLKSFVEGVVSRVDVDTPQGRYFVVEVRHEVILGREHRIRPGFQDYVRYECPNDFPDRIEVLSTAKPEMEPDLALREVPEHGLREADQQPAFSSKAGPKPELELVANAEADSERFEVKVERSPMRKRGGLMAALFGRKK
jgi:hypothetical protein